MTCQSLKKTLFEFMTQNLPVAGMDVQNHAVGYALKEKKSLYLHP